MKEKNKRWQRLILQTLAAVFLIVLAIIVRMLERQGEFNLPIEARVSIELPLAIALIVLYQAGRQAYWLVCYYFYNPDRLTPIIPDGFKGFHHRSSDEVLEQIKEAYGDCYRDKIIISVQKAALWRHRGRKHIWADMLVQQADGGYHGQLVRLKHVTIVLEVTSQDREIHETRTDYYYFFNGNFFTSHRKGWFSLPRGWKIRYDILGNNREEYLEASQEGA